jgi:hypothetical protein
VRGGVSGSTGGSEVQVSTKDDGGPAYPVVDNTNEVSCEGMSLRDAFLKSVMQGLAANPNVIGHNPQHGWGIVNCNESQLVGFAMDLVDAMLEARKQ